MLARVAESVLPVFDSLIDRAGEPLAESVDWWASSPASRNSYLSGLLHKCCLLALMARLRDENQLPSAVTVDCPDLARILAGQTEVTVRYARAQSGWRDHLRPIVAPWRSTIRLLQTALASHGLRRSHLLPPQAILLGVFVTSEMIGQTCFRDHYFPGLASRLPAPLRDRVTYLATFTGRDIACDVRKLTALGVRFVTRQQFLHPSDFLFALTHAWRAARLHLPRLEFAGFSGVEMLIARELKASRWSIHTLESILAYRFAKRLAEAGRHDVSLVDWHEGQSYNKCTLLGFSRFLPRVPVTSYIGAAPRPWYRCMYPTAQEVRAKVAPKRMAVIGPTAAKQFRSLGHPIEILTGPAFRFQDVLNAPPHDGTREGVLVCLPLGATEAQSLMHQISAVAKLSAFAAVPFWVKAHPLNRDLAEAALYDSNAGNLHIVEGSLIELTDRSAAVVGAATSVLLEAVARGVPVVVASKSALMALDHPLPPELCGIAYELAVTVPLLAAALTRLLDRPSSSIAIDASQLFSPITDESVQTLIGCQTS